MLFDDRKQALCRALVGGIIGLAVLIPLGGLINDVVSGGVIAMGTHTPFRLVSCDLERWAGSEPLALAIQLALYFILGAETGIATLPFAEEGRVLLARSLLHFALTAALLTLTCTLLGWAWSWRPMAVYLILLASVYLLIWLGRWIGWYTELSAIRKKLGLAPGPSPLKWWESLPYLPFAVLLCLALPAGLGLFDAADVPVLRALLYPCLLLPVGGAASGFSLGKRRGWCPLYPAACGALTLASVFLVYNQTALYMVGIAVAAALLGNLAGTLLRRPGERRRG